MQIVIEEACAEEEDARDFKEVEKNPLWQDSYLTKSLSLCILVGGCSFSFMIVDASLLFSRNATVMDDREVTNMMKRMLTNYETKIRPNYTGLTIITYAYQNIFFHILFKFYSFQGNLLETFKMVWWSWGSFQINRVLLKSSISEAL